MKSKPSIYIIVPCFNEEAILAFSNKKLEDQISKLANNNFCCPLNSRILYIDDGSKADPNIKEWMAFKPTAVFNANDLEGATPEGIKKLEELIKLCKFQAGYQVKPEPERLENAEAALKSWKVPVSFGGNQAFYAPAIDRIQLPERSAFNTPAAFCATWAHEAIHSTGHHSRLDRDQKGKFGSKSYAIEELVAELGAVLLGDRLEFGSEIESHAAYLSHWIGLLKKEPKILFQVMRDANSASKLIWPEELQAPLQAPVGQIPMERPRLVVGM